MSRIKIAQPKVAAAVAEAIAHTARAGVNSLRMRKRKYRFPVTVTGTPFRRRTPDASVAPLIPWG